MRSAVQLITVICIVALMAGCASAPPNDPQNVCAIFAERPDWYPAARSAARRWGTPIPTLLAFIRSESGFRSDAEPPRTRILWIIPGPRPSDAYGYAQALDSTWDHYRDATGHSGADRDDFADAVDFIGWYNELSYRDNGISKSDPYHQYLAYHEGQGGYARGSWRDKPWLKAAARRVAALAERYRGQLPRCRAALDEAADSHWWWPF